MAPPLGFIVIYPVGRVRHVTSALGSLSFRPRPVCLALWLGQMEETCKGLEGRKGKIDPATSMSSSGERLGIESTVLVEQGGCRILSLHGKHSELWQKYMLKWCSFSRNGQCVVVIQGFMNLLPYQKASLSHCGFLTWRDIWIRAWLSD